MKVTIKLILYTLLKIQLILKILISLFWKKKLLKWMGMFKTTLHWRKANKRRGNPWHCKQRAYTAGWRWLWWTREGVPIQTQVPGTGGLVFNVMEEQETQLFAYTQRALTNPFIWLGALKAAICMRTEQKSEIHKLRELNKVYPVLRAPNRVKKSPQNLET